MNTKKLLSLLLTITLLIGTTAVSGLTANAETTADTIDIHVGEIYDCSEYVDERKISDEAQEGNEWYFSTTDESKLKVVSVCVIEEMLHIYVKGIAEGNGVQITGKTYDAGSASWVDNGFAINGIFRVVPASDYLDLDSTTADILDSNQLDQYYNLTEIDGEFTDVTRVKLNWEINDINAIRTDNKIWDTENLCWKTDSSSTLITRKGTAKFTIENYSSVKINATASFQAAGKFKGTASYDVTDGKVTVDTANGNETYSEKNVPTAVINATITTDSDDFNDVEVTTKPTKYGTYTLTISAAESVTLTFTNSSKLTTLTYDTKEYGYNESFSFSVPKNSVVSVIKDNSTGIATLKVDNKTVTMTPKNDYNGANFTISDGTVLTESTEVNVYACILSGSKVTLADGSTKLIDDVTENDMLMTFNFYEGKLDSNRPMFIMKHENITANVITITLDNGTVLEMCDWQQFFDMDAKTFFDIDICCYKEAIGKNVLFIENGTVTSARITNATMQVRTCTSYDIFTEYNKNFVANGILTVEPETYLQGVYTINDDLKIDMEQYQKDIDTYGRYTYSEFSDIMTQEEFAKMNIADKKIAVGKGTVSEEWLFALYKTWTPLYR